VEYAGPPPLRPYPRSITFDFPFKNIDERKTFLPNWSPRGAIFFASTLQIASKDFKTVQKPFFPFAAISSGPSHKACLKLPILTPFQKTHVSQLHGTQIAKNIFTPANI
jgi:hypothetical protein